MNLNQRLARLSVEATSGCRIWTGAKIKTGYGKIWIQGKCYRAHRVSYVLTYGSIPEGVYVLHKCDTPSCIKPSHLFLGTAKTNSDDMINKGRDRHRYGSAVSNSKLTDREVNEIRSLAAAKETQAVIAKRFNVSQSLISRILNNKRRNREVM